MIQRKVELPGMTEQIQEIHEIQDEDSQPKSTLYPKRCMYSKRSIWPQSLSEFQNEIHVLRRMDHPNIIRAHETYTYTSDDGKRMIGIVLELCEGGDLYSRPSYTEQQAGTILYKLVEAVNYMHQHNFIHRDIKLENILFESKESDADIKLVDFGISTMFVKNQNLDQTVGTVYTIAPQVFMGHYTQAADMWSVGVVAFILLSGEKPFWAKKWSALGQLIIKGKCSFDSPAWATVSEGAKSFVTKLMEYNPTVRYTAEQALNDEWLAQFKPTVNPAVVRDVLSHLKQVSQMSEFEKLAWLVAARKADPHEIAQRRTVFEELDQNHDGQISYQKFKTAMIKILGCKSKEVAEIFHNVDVQHVGVVEYTTFLAALLAVQGRLQDDRLFEVFDHFDVEHCGYMTHEHLRRILGSEVSDLYIDKLMQEVDASKDGKMPVWTESSVTTSSNEC